MQNFTMFHWKQTRVHTHSTEISTCCISWCKWMPHKTWYIHLTNVIRCHTKIHTDLQFRWITLIKSMFVSNGLHTLIEILTVKTHLVLTWCHFTNNTWTPHKHSSAKIIFQVTQMQLKLNTVKQLVSSIMVFALYSSKMIQLWHWHSDTHHGPNWH